MTGPSPKTIFICNECDKLETEPVKRHYDEQTDSFKPYSWNKVCSLLNKTLKAVSFWESNSDIVTPIECPFLLKKSEPIPSQFISTEPKLESRYS